MPVLVEVLTRVAVSAAGALLVAVAAFIAARILDRRRGLARCPAHLPEPWGRCVLNSRHPLRPHMTWHPTPYGRDVVARWWT